MSDQSSESNQNRALFSTLLASKPIQSDPTDRIVIIGSVTAHLIGAFLLLWLVPGPAAQSGVFRAATESLVLVEKIWAAPRIASEVKEPPRRVVPKVKNRAARNVVSAPQPLPDLTEEAKIARSPTIDWIDYAESELRRSTDQAASIAASSSKSSRGNGTELAGLGITMEELKVGPRFTPYTIGPELLNRSEIATVLSERYPRALRTMGIGGLSMLWLLIDTDGKARKAVLHTSSGYDPFDALALEIVSLMRFSPAQNSGSATAVWVQLPVRFRVVDAF